MKLDLNEIFIKTQNIIKDIPLLLVEIARSRYILKIHFRRNIKGFGVIQAFVVIFFGENAYENIKNNH